MANALVLPETEHTWSESPVYDPTLRTLFSSGDEAARLIVESEDVYYEVNLTVKYMTLSQLIALENWEKEILIGSDTFSFTDWNGNNWTMILMDQISYETVKAKETLFNASIKMYGRKN